ncbi:Anaphase-promoting complex subunit 1 [Tulasnella sp. 419]|nr:Anaphase-promoting complex subunit 1 [Tulasnella sp. 419]
MNESIPITSFSPPISSGASYITITQPPPPQPSAPESDLLKSIRQALSATTPIPYESPRRTVFSGRDGDEELCWLDRTVTWSIGGIQRRKWTFETETKDQVLWACFTSFDSNRFTKHMPFMDTPVKPSSTSSSQKPSFTTAPASDRDIISTFGAFSQVRPSTTADHAASSMNAAQAAKFPSGYKVRCICIFLTSFAMIYTKEGGMEFATNIPFHVKTARELVNGGLMIERVVGEDEEDGDHLPTLFTLSAPYDEVKVVGFAHKIKKGYTLPYSRSASQSPELEAEIIVDPPPQPGSSPKPTVPSFTKSESIIFLSSDSTTIGNRIIVSHDHQRQKARLWRYVQETPDVFPKPEQHPLTSRYMHSLGIPNSQSNPSEATTTTKLPTSPGPSKPSIPVSKSAVPATPTQDTIAASLALAEQTARPKAPGPLDPRNTVAPNGLSKRHTRIQSTSRNELSITMDRMALGGRTGGATGEELVPRLVDDGQMRPEFWMQCMYEVDAPNDLTGKPPEVTAMVVDSQSTLLVTTVAIHISTTQTLHLFRLSVAEDFTCTPQKSIPALAAAPVNCIRTSVLDIIFIRPNHSIAVITYDCHELDIHVTDPESTKADSSDMSIPTMDMDISQELGKRPLGFKDPIRSAVTVVYSDQSERRIDLRLWPTARALTLSFMTMAVALPTEVTWEIRKRYLVKWMKRNRVGYDEEEFECFAEAVMETVRKDELEGAGAGSRKQPPIYGQRIASMAIKPDSWTKLANSSSHSTLSHDPALRFLSKPHSDSLSHTVNPAMIVPEKVTNPSELAAPVMMTLHLVAEAAMTASYRHTDVALLAPLLIKLGRFTRMDYADYWSRFCPESPDAWAPVDAYNFEPDSKLYVRPPDFFDYIRQRLHYQNGISPFPVPLSISQQRGWTPSFEYGRVDPFGTTKFALDILTALTEPSGPDNSPLGRARKMVMVMQGYGGQMDYQKLPFGLMVPVMEAIRLCQDQPPMDWPAVAYDIVDRPDLAKMASGDGGFTFGDAYKYKREHEGKKEKKTIRDIVQEAKMAADGLTVQPEANDPFSREFTDIRFGIDRRMEEVERMLQSSYVTTVKIHGRPELNESDLAKEHQGFAILISERTMSLSLGRSIYTFGSLGQIDSDSYLIPRLELNVRLVPHGVTVPIEVNRIQPDARVWAEFHNGTAAALRIARPARGVDSTWIAYNRPAELTSEHAGFILGLGLNGHLREMYTWHTFSYLTPKHDLTTVAILIGLAASYVGTGDLMITKMLTVHTPALLPVGSAELNLAFTTQMAGLMGIGILYLGRKDRRMAEAALQEIGGRDFNRIDVTNEHREAYSINAALAFGMIMCGQGANSSSPADLEMIAKLRALVHGQPSAPDGKNSQPIYDVTITSPAATIALGLMFLKTGRQDIASMFDIAHTPLILSRIQPSTLLITTLARLLILWNDITPSVEWVTSQVPKKTAENDELQGYEDAIKDSYDLAYYNIVAGVCFSIALKYAGTADQRAETTLIHYYDAFTKTANQSAPNYDAQIKRSAVRDSLNLVSICLGIVMAGTGELNALRRFRFSHGQLAPFIKYGSHMTTHMALGMLFLGGGRYTFGTSNAAIASLVAAFYPRWPNTSSDTKGLLPALRHLWVLAVEPRCLIARDVDSGQTVYIPVKIKVREGNEIRTFQYTSPSLIPDFSNLVSISIDSPRYWSYFIDLESKPLSEFAKNLMRFQTIWVKRRSGYLGYGEDPRGNRSVFARVGFRIGDTVTMDHPTGSKDERARVAAELKHFITSFSTDVRTVSFADWLCSGEPESRLEGMMLSYCQQSLLECLLLDKLSTLGPLTTLYRSRYFTGPEGDLQSPSTAIALRNLLLATDYYQHAFYKHFGGRLPNNMVRPPLIRSQLIQAAASMLDDFARQLRQNDPEVSAIIKRYYRGEALRQTEAGSKEEREHQNGLLRKMAFYLVQARVTVPEQILAIREIITEARQDGGLSSFGRFMDPETLERSLLIVMRSFINTMYSAHMWPHRVQHLEDIRDAAGGN